MRRGTAGVGLLAVMFLFVLEPLPVHAASTLVQQASAFCWDQSGFPSCSNTISVSFSSNVASGNVLVVAISAGNYYLETMSLSSIGDSLSSSFTPAVSLSAQSLYNYVYYATLTSNGFDSVTVTFTTGGTCPGACNYDQSEYIHIYEVSGVTTSVATGMGSGTLSGSSGTLSTSSSAAFQSGAFLVAIASAGCLSNSWVAGLGFTLSPNPNNDEFISISKAEYSTSGVSSPTTFPVTVTTVCGSGVGWAEVGIALNPGTNVIKTTTSTLTTAVATLVKGTTTTATSTVPATVTRTSTNVYSTTQTSTRTASVTQTSTSTSTVSVISTRVVTTTSPISTIIVTPTKTAATVTTTPTTTADTVSVTVTSTGATLKVPGTTTGTDTDTVHVTVTHYSLTVPFTTVTHTSTRFSPTTTLTTTAGTLVEPATTTTVSKTATTTTVTTAPATVTKTASSTSTSTVTVLKVVKTTTQTTAAATPTVTVVITTTTCTGAFCQA